MVIHFLESRKEKCKVRVLVTPAKKGKSAVYQVEEREEMVDVPVEFEVNPNELVGSVALRYAKAKGMPEPPPDVIPTLKDAVRGQTFSPRLTIREATVGGALMFQLTSTWTIHRSAR